jgi:hypothetical protein
LKSEEASTNDTNHARDNRISIHNEAAEKERLLIHQQHNNGRRDAIPPVPRRVLASSSGGCLQLVMGRTGHGLFDCDSFKPYDYSNVDNDYYYYFVRRR